jgi:hypothetical protein
MSQKGVVLDILLIFIALAFLGMGAMLAGVDSRDGSDWR